MQTRRYIFAVMGLALGPLAWAISSQLNYVLVGWQCTAQIRIIPWLALLLMVVALLGGFASWRAWSDLGGDPRPQHMETRRFVSAVSVMISGLFAAVILMQALAGFIFDGCEP